LSKFCILFSMIKLYLMSRRRQQSENALFIFCLLKNTIQPLGAKDFDLNQGAKLEL